jgi:hypothetical protein
MLVPFSLSAHLSLGIEVPWLLTLGIATSYEQGNFRGDFATHFLLVEYIDELMRGKYEHGFAEIPISFRATVSSKLFHWRNQAIYGGVGALCYLELYEQKYQVGFGPAFQYAWKFPSKQIEFNLDMIVPLFFTGNHDNTQVDDFPTDQGWARFILFLLVPSIGLSYYF